MFPLCQCSAPDGSSLLRFCRVFVFRTTLLAMACRNPVVACSLVLLCVGAASASGDWMSCFATMGPSGEVEAFTLQRLSGGPSSPWRQNEAARAQFNDTMNTVGWSFLHVTTNPAMSNTAQASAAGYVEGKLTATRIYQCVDPCCPCFVFVVLVMHVNPAL